ncbi:MAG: hypothetical protein ACMXYM_02865 [Candidatus Woesearchaeota archaeon]
MIPIVLTAAVLLIGCEANGTPTDTPDAPDPTQAPSEPDGLTVSFADGVLSYTARIMVPTPCHDVSIEENILESDPAHVEIRARFIEPDPDVMCAQVIDEREISGTITLGEMPGSVTLVTPFETYEAHV